MTWARWLPALAVAAGAAVATAHGVYAVAAAARVPEPIAWLYPVITDGLALVAYAATSRLTGSGARYAWSVVVVAAAMSGLAQAVLLATDDLSASPQLRFGVGAWPALACALVAHLLHLMADGGSDERGDEEPPTTRPAVEPATDLLPAAATTDGRVGALAARLAAGEDLTGPGVAAELDVSDRTGRRLLADARSHLEQRPTHDTSLHLVTGKDTSA